MVDLKMWLEMSALGKSSRHPSPVWVVRLLTVSCEKHQENICCHHNKMKSVFCCTHQSVFVNSALWMNMKPRHSLSYSRKGWQTETAWGESARYPAENPAQKEGHEGPYRRWRISMTLLIKQQMTAKGSSLSLLVWLRTKVIRWGSRSELSRKLKLARQKSFRRNCSQRLLIWEEKTQSWSSSHTQRMTPIFYRGSLQSPVSIIP